jgi:hypothetical protein
MKGEGMGDDMQQPTGLDEASTINAPTDDPVDNKPVEPIEPVEATDPASGVEPVKPVEEAGIGTEETPETPTE